MLKISLLIVLIQIYKVHLITCPYRINNRTLYTRVGVFILFGSVGFVIFVFYIKKIHKRKRIGAGVVGFNGSTIIYPANQPYGNNMYPSNNGYQVKNIPVGPVVTNYPISNPQVSVSYQPIQPYENYYNPIKY
ncbi:hypothetical protein BpHYR1_023585 [Brachionus plicatilis]|uniref:Uncharacterized protein n=1 Tax=Brachionus plicatilis TaxID=10195 RepID=A0A3M7TBI2_BRAPC|nr:hypothetical protein BpHYR1_023585 [Brachionus plicatilis]